jgi:hypothetical protein
MYDKLTAKISANRRLWIVLLIFTAIPFLIKVAWPSSAQSPEAPSQERKFKMKEGINVPLEVKVRNLQSKNWLEDLEIEVKNIGDKPIYSIVAYILLPDDKRAERVGIPLDYGNPENISFHRLAEPQDPHINPGDTYVFKIAEKFRKGFEGQERSSPEVHKKLELWFEIISFGDGTGLVNGGKRDHRKTGLDATPSKKKQTVDFGLG